MKRDNELIRQLLLAIEDRPPGPPFSGSEICPEDADPAVVAEHIRLLMDAGLIDALTRQYVEDLCLLPSRIKIGTITWKGHEFLDAIRSDTIWAKTKSKVADAGGSVSLSVLGEVAGAIAKGMMGLS
ncbi:DUF2513 domain-containing protein [Pseudoxanthomonas sp. JBR18]|uniref:DUF2513 domain-containing protein n=1 Tax=Pseudoxanthomonas sp. JBR18 TaxID=2969308 RepID=UPI002305D356|nr:DUF2513 domain-containing protein [Pseudoxanthomonas sp. JBR18]WCE02810.1 DUF2513 domain-containing protein [Pseudoxanthomonas sp. JBR18]